MLSVLRIWTRPTDPEDWKIKHQTNLLRFASSKSGSPVKHRLGPIWWQGDLRAGATVGGGGCYIIRKESY